jgi:hypothetical protein
LELGSPRNLRGGVSGPIAQNVRLGLEIDLMQVLLVRHHFWSDCASRRFLHAERDLRPTNLAKESSEAA